MENYLQKAHALVSFISPVIAPHRNQVLCYAISTVAKTLDDQSWEQLRFTHDVYPVVASTLKVSLDSAQRCIFRAVEDCWMDGKNPHLNEIIGHVLPYKPKPSEFLLYCAYYVHYNHPYHVPRSESASVPIIF